MKKNKRALFFYVFILLGLINKSYSQDTYKLHLKDHHSDQITDILVTKDGERIITIDKSGKILKYNTDNFSYHSTLKKRNNCLIESPRLIFDGKGLFFKSKDSLWILDSKGKVLVKNVFKGNVISNKKSPFTIISESNTTATSFLVSVLNDKFQLFKSFKPNTNVNVATINKDSTHIAYLEQTNLKSQNLVYRDLQNNQILWQSKVEDINEVLYPFFNEKINKLYTITINDKENILSVFSYTNGKREAKPEVTIPWFSTVFSTSIVDDFLDKKKIIITDKSNFPKNPIVLSLENNKLTLSNINIKEGAYSGGFISNNKLVTSNVFNTYNSIANFTISTIKNRKTVNSYPNFPQKFYEGIFLPDDSFLVQGSVLKKSNFLSNYELQVKYFTSGTFNNRFNTLSFKDYLEVNHKVSFYTDNPFFDKKTGLVVFRGSDLSTNQSYIFKYSFIDDKVTKLYKIKDKYFSIIDFDATSNKLLLSPKKYFNTGHTKPQPLALVENNVVKEFTGLYKFAKFSEGAKHILTINDENLAQVRVDIKTIILEEKLKNTHFLLHKAENGFVVSYKYFSQEKYVFENESIFFVPNDDDTFKSEKKPFIYVNELDYKNNKIALVIENVGVIVGEKRIEKDYLEPIKSVSFNKDASKLMISYANGKISVVDTETLKEIGGMFHPSEKEHVFYDANNHYFSNTNANDFLFVTKDDKKISLKNADQNLYKPAEVLNVFGKPNQEYLTLLKKATSLRINNNTFVEVKPNNQLKNTNKKGDLYVLSIGVSKYKQEAYNLTFADKDAFDIANLYGKLDSVTIKNFKDDFLSDKYILQNLENNNLSSINKYLGEYTSLGNLYSVDLDGEIWLEIRNENFFIWNFKTQKVDKINLPKDFKIDLYSNQQIFIAPNKNEFYVRSSNNKIYSYNFNSKKPEEVLLPFKKDEVDFSKIQPLKNGNWFYFTKLTNKNEFQTIIANDKTNKKDTVTYKTDKYIFSDEVISMESWDTLGANFKSLSNNGNYLLFSGYDDFLYLQKLSKDEIPTKIPIKTTYSDKFSISDDGKKITVLSSKLNEFRFKITTYNLEGTILKTKTFIDKEYNIEGMYIVNSIPKFIKSSPSLVSDYNYIGFSSNKILSESTPFSFNKTFVKKITNKEATKENIESEIIDFLKNTKQEDQVIIFIAGHGVLDKKNNYYYAPHNMDFNDVTKNGVAFKTLINSLSSTKAINKLLLMDTCHAGNTLDIVDSNNNKTAVSEQGKRGTVTQTSKKAPKFKMSDIVSTLFDDFLSKSGVTILSASSGADVAFENKELSNGAFTSAYLKILKSKMGVYRVTEEGIQKTIPLTEDFIAEVLKEVIELTKGKQIPDIREINKNVILKAW
ncbi:caspase family protein [Polaribacter vadi]|uniref:caspase family protein n=1 Tax=Polaribacter TaxID=52959 RepID=UPI001C09384E|nr:MULTISPECIES: caspase family protein [Polaribacter]MBU3011396.1 caspase family protein [Polaribacter vadi]MDO6741208.1 caspase family protein [Polaribacter sp. 1_MG-2023]